MNMNTKMCSWELQKAGYLLTEAGKMGMDVSGYGMLDLNMNSGNVYLWLEDYDFTLYMPISCELQESNIWVLWTNPEDGEETEKTLDEFGNNKLYNIEKWTEELRKETEESEE